MEVVVEDDVVVVDDVLFVEPTFRCLAIPEGRFEMTPAPLGWEDI